MTKMLIGLSAACVAGAVALAVGSLASAQGAAMGPDRAAKFIAARQASLDMSAVTFGAMMHEAADGHEPKTMGFEARALNRWAHVLPTTFPEGTGPESGVKTAALPTIWSDRAGFDKAATDYAAATDKLLDLAKANDVQGFKDQLKVVDGTCGACHSVYRAKPAGR